MLLVISNEYQKRKPLSSSKLSGIVDICQVCSLVRLLERHFCSLELGSIIPYDLNQLLIPVESHPSESLPRALTKPITLHRLQ
jgi:hypothetical protein